MVNSPRQQGLPIIIIVMTITYGIGVKFEALKSTDRIVVKMPGVWIKSARAGAKGVRLGDKGVELGE